MSAFEHSGFPVESGFEDRLDEGVVVEGEGYLGRVAGFAVWV